MGKVLIEYCASTGGLIVKRECTCCGQIQTVDIPPKWVNGFEKWVNNEELIQNALSEMDAGDREVLVSGVCRNCWGDLFKAWEV